MKLRLPGLLFSSIVFVIACGPLPFGRAQVEKPSFQVTGRIYVMGNEPFTQAAVEADDGRVFALTGKDARQLRAFQGKRLTLEGTLTGKNSRGVEELEVKSYKIDEGEKKRGARD